jgi:hypothetical protein
MRKINLNGEDYILRADVENAVENAVAGVAVALAGTQPRPTAQVEDLLERVGKVIRPHFPFSSPNT